MTLFLLFLNFLPIILMLVIITILIFRTIHNYNKPSTIYKVVKRELSYSRFHWSRLVISIVSIISFFIGEKLMLNYTEDSYFVCEIFNFSVLVLCLDCWTLILDNTRYVKKYRIKYPFEFTPKYKKQTKRLLNLVTATAILALIDMLIFWGIIEGWQ